MSTDQTRSGPNSPAPRIPGVPLSLAVLVALVMRLVRFPQDHGSSDAVDLFTLVEATTCEGQSPWTSGLLLLQYRLGGVQPLLTWPVAELADLLELRLSPLVWSFPALLAGAALPLVVWALLRTLGASRAGLVAAWLVAVFPPAVLFSRHPGAPWMLEACVDLGTLALTAAFVRSPSRGIGWAWAACFALSAWVGNQSVALFALVPFVAAAHLVLDPEARQAPLPWLARLAGPWLAVPVLSWALALVLGLGMGTGHLAHALLTKPKVLGWYGPAVLDAAVADVGWPGLVLLGAGAVGAAFAARRAPRAALILLALFAAYTLPFLFLIPPGSTVLRTYLVQGLDALVLLAALGLGALPPWPRRGTVALVAVPLLLATASAAWRLPAPALGVLPHQGSHVPVGALYATLPLLDDLPDDAVVFTDAYGGGGLEPNVVEVVTRRSVVGLYDAVDAEAPYTAFAETPVDVVLVTRGRGDLAEATFPEHRPSLRVERDGETLLEVRTRGATEVVTRAASTARYASRPEARLCGAPGP